MKVVPVLSDSPSSSMTQFKSVVAMRKELFMAVSLADSAVLLGDPQRLVSVNADAAWRPTRSPAHATRILELSL
jgi:hypothetical protein